MPNLYVCVYLKFNKLFFIKFLLEIAKAIMCLFNLQKYNKESSGTGSEEIIKTY